MNNYLPYLHYTNLLLLDGYAPVFILQHYNISLFLWGVVLF